MTTHATPASVSNRRSHRTRLVIIAIVVAFSATTVLAESPPVFSVTVVSDEPDIGVKIADVLGIEVGKPLDRNRLREAVASFYAGGNVEWLRIETTPSSEGLAVRIRVSFKSRIETIKVRVANPLLRLRVKRWIQLGVGDTVSAAQVETARQRVVRRLQARGHAAAAVDAFVDYKRRSNSVEIEFDIDPGPVEVLGSVVLDGLDNPEDAAAVMPKVRLGAALTARREDRIRDRTEAALRRLGYWEAEVVGLDRQTVEGEVELLVRVAPGTRYQLQIVAPPEAIPIVEGAFPDPVEETIHPAQTETLAAMVRDRLQGMGYLLAAVNATIDDHVVRIEVDLGEQHAVAAVDFPGAENVSRRQLMDAVRVRTGRVGGWRGQELSQATLDEDRRVLEGLYHSLGFVDAQIAAPVVEPVDSGVRIVFPVEEGLRWTVIDLSIEGLPVEAAAELESAPLELTRGSPWSPGAVDSAVERLKTALVNSGYPDARVEPEVDTSTPGVARVTLTVEPGPFVRTGSVVIAGLRHTRESLVAKTVERAGVRPGEPLSRRSLIAAQRDLYALGLFRRVDIVPMPGQERRPERNIIIRCEEGDQRSYLFGVGYSDRDAARVILGWSHLNLFGGAHAFSAEVSLSRNEQRYSLNLREQRTFGLAVPSHLAVYRTYEEFSAYSLVRRGLWIDVGDRLRRPLRPWFRYEYEVVANRTLPDPATDVGPALEESKVASVIPSLEWDTRDNPLAPKKGTFSAASLQYAFPAFQASENFLKLNGSITRYQPLLNGFASFGMRLGVIRPLGSGSDNGLPENLQIPLSNRFFAGGRSSHRAFATDRLGIPGQTIIDDIPVGGNAIFLLNLQFQRKITGPFEGVVFVDAGNVWASPSHVRFSDIRWGAGFGVYFVTPAGPLRAEYGWKLDRREGESRGQFFLSFGVPF